MSADEDMTRAEIRAALHAIQEGKCAICRVSKELCLDHDHRTGLARGLLCRSCNQREGMTDDPDVKAYRENPPAWGRRWLWKFPDTWTTTDTAAWRESGLTLLGYMPVHIMTAALRKAVLNIETIKTAQQRTWTE